MQRDFNATGLGFIFVMFFVVSGFGQLSKSQPIETKNETPALDFGQTIEQAIAGGERHAYKLRLDQNQFIRIEVEQSNCDVIVALNSPEKINIFEFKDDNVGDGPEVQTAGIEAAGEYELRIISFEEPTQKGKYTLKFSEMRPATEKELALTTGFRTINGLKKNVKTSAATAEQLRQAIKDFQIALEKFRFGGNRRWEALTLSSIGSFYTRLGDWGKAVELQKQALEINREIGAKEDIALLLSNMGTTYLKNNEPQKALEVLYEALSITAKDEDIMNESRASNLIGNVYEENGNHDRALLYYTQALKKAQEISHDEFTGNSLNNLGRVNFALGENQKALDFFRKAVESNRKTNNKRQEASSLGNLGQAHFALGDPAKAFELLNESLAIDRGLGDRVAEAGILKKFARLYLGMGETDKAVEFLKRSLEIYRAIEDAPQLADTLLLMAKAEARKNNLEAAQNRAEESIGLIEKIRSRVETTDLRDSFSANLQDFYGFYVELLMQRQKREPEKNFAALAFEVNERARARGLLNLLAESNVNIREGVDPKLLQKETGLKNLLSARLENFTKALGGKAKPEESDKLKLEIEQIRGEYEQTQAQIRQTSPRYSALTQPKTMNVREIQTQVLDDNSVLLEYALGEARSHLWIVSKDGFRFVELPAKNEIEKAAKTYYNALTARNKEIKFETAAERSARIQQADAALPALSKNLSRMILAPAAGFLADKKLLVVTDGALHYIPFTALENPNPKNGFLIETNEIVNLPSASALAILRRETENRPAAAKTLAILADPIFDREDERFRQIGGKRSKNKPQLAALAKERTRSAGDLLTREGLELARLPFTRREADSIGSLVPARQQQKLLDFAASRRAAMSAELANYRFVHFATHGFINNENPELSGIVLSMFDENGAEQEGFLRVGDIYNLKMPAEMVVLSGCKTGLGREIKGEGLVGLTRGFIYAGARRVTVSLWDVNDEATAELMSAFYREMLGEKKLSPAAALRQSQIAMIRDKRWQNPYFWATFIMQGEPR